MDFIVGDVVFMKKPHPCGSREWTVLRAGMDFRIECRGCGRQVMLPRAKFEKGVKKNLSRPEAMNRNPAKNEINPETNPEMKLK